MYQITCDNEVIHDIRVENRVVLSPTLDLEVGKNGTLSFTIPPQNECYNLIKQKKSIIQVYQIDKIRSYAKELFRGTIFSVKLDFYNRKQVECEGELSFFNDSVVRPYEYQGDVETLFKQYANNHNSLVSEFKRFIPRRCTVTDSNDYITRANINYPTTRDEMNEKLLNILGGHFETGHNEDGTRWIDYLADYERTSSQIIQFGENLLDITQYIKTEDVATRIIPLGAKPEDGEERLNIKSVNGGLDYIQDDAAVALFGIIEKTVEYDDVTLASNLLTKGQKYLQECINQTVSIELNAADLHNLDVNIEAFRIGDMVRVLSKPHGLDRFFLLSKLHLALDKPSECSMILGATFKTFTQSQVDGQKKLNSQVAHAVTTVNTLTTDVKKNKSDIVEINTVVSEITGDYVGVLEFEEYKTEVNQKIASVYTVKGSVSNYQALANITNKKVGDVYNVLTTGANYVWTSDGWDKLSETIDLSLYLKNEDAETNYTKIADFNDLVARVEALERSSGGGVV